MRNRATDHKRREAKVARRRRRLRDETPERYAARQQAIDTRVGVGVERLLEAVGVDRPSRLRKDRTRPDMVRRPCLCYRRPAKNRTRVGLVNHGSHWREP